jgi:hypothetical protein
MSAPIQFYKSRLTRCSCGKAAAFVIMGSGNVKYDYACERCADKRIRELDKTHNGSQPAPAGGSR